MDIYELLVAIMLDGENGTALPSDSTRSKFMLRRLLKNNFVESSIETIPFNKNYFDN